MAVVLSGTQWYTRANFFGNAANDFTVMAWCYLTTTPANGFYRNLIGMTAAKTISVLNNGGVITWLIAHPVADSVGTQTPAINTDYHVALTRRGQDERLYVNGILEVSVTNAEAGATGLIIGDFNGSDSGDEWEGGVWGVKAWDGQVLSVDEIRAEMRQAAPIFHSGYAYPFVTDAAAEVERVYGSRVLTKAGTVTALAKLLQWRAVTPQGDEKKASSGAQAVTAPAISSTLLLFAPTIAPGPVTLTPPAIASTLALFAPSLAYAMSLPAIGAGSALFAPTVAPGPVTLTGAAIGPGSALFAPALAYAMSLPAIASGAQLFAPSLAYAMSLPAIGPGSSLFAPALAYAMTLPAIAAGSALFAPTLTLGNSLALPAIGSTAALFAPALAYAMSLPTIGPGSTLAAPSLAYAASLPAIGSGSALFAPTVAPGAVTLTNAAIASGLILRAPTVSPGPVTLTMAAIASGLILRAPSLAQGAAGLVLPALGPGSTLFPPFVGTVLGLPFIASSAVIYAPNVWTVGLIHLTDLDMTAPTLAGATMTGPRLLSVTMTRPDLLDGTFDAAE